MMMQYAPIALFVYNRPRHTQQAVDALRNNYLAKDSELFIFSEAPKDKNDEENVSKVRRYIAAIEGFGKVSIIERERNLGLARSIITGVTELIVQYGRVIVLEDDLVTSAYFLKFMNDGLSAYQDDEQVISICGYMYPINKTRIDTFFLRIPDCWGWATWKRGWDLFMEDGIQLYRALKVGRLLRKFNLDNAFNYAKMLKMQTQGKNDSWAVRWYASALLNKKLSLYPWRSLVINIGFDGSGRHRGYNDYFKTEFSNEPIDAHKIPVFEDERAVRAIGLYLKKQRFNIGRMTLDFFRKQWYNNNNKTRNG